MATSPTSKSALLSAAAKDDFLGSDVDIFHISDLLANDPGGANKNGIIGKEPGSSFFFGSVAGDQQDQKAYLEAHDIHLNADGSYSLGENATSFDYFVRMGNSGTWSKAHVDIADHAGGLLWGENFDNYVNTSNDSRFGVIDLTSGSD